MHFLHLITHSDKKDVFFYEFPSFFPLGNVFPSFFVKKKTLLAEFYSGRLQVRRADAADSSSVGNHSLFTSRMKTFVHLLSVFPTEYCVFVPSSATLTDFQRHFSTLDSCHFNTTTTTLSTMICLY